MVFANKLCKINNALDKWGATRGTTRLPPFYQRGLGNSSITKNTISKSPLISLFRGQNFGCPPFSPSKIVHSTWNPLKQMDPKNHVWSNPQRDPSRSQVPVFLLESKPWLFMTSNRTKSRIFKWVDRGAEGPNPKSIHMRFFKIYF